MSRDMDVLELLAAARPAVLDPDDGARERVLAGALADGPASRSRVRRRPFSIGALGLGLGGATAVGAAVLLALLAAQAVALPGHRAVSPGAPATASASARDVLLAAAAQPPAAPASGRYWHEGTRTSSVLRTGQGADAYLIEIGSQLDNWFAAGPSDRSWFVTQSLGAHPLTAADEAAWRRAGSPDHFAVSVDKGGAEAKGTFDALPGPAYRVPIDPAAGLFDLGRSGFSLRDLQTLPADPAALRARLLDLRRAGDPAAATNAGKDLTPWLFKAAGSLLSAPVSPEVRSAALRVLADLPGVTDAGQVTDSLGRRGVAVATTSADPVSGTVQTQLVIDTATGRLLAAQTIVLRAGTAEPWARPGMRVSSVTTVQAAWTNDTPPSLPPPPTAAGR